MSSDIILASPDETAALGVKIARLLAAGDCVTLRGDLGTGKTTFVRALIHALAADAGEVVSPTFTLVQSYPVTAQGKSVTLWHYDLYRLKHGEEVMELGLEEALDQGITLIEWPELVETHLPVDRLDIQLSYGRTEHERRVEFDAKGRWKARLEMLRE